ncbi:UNVERIFIED_ORG: hypothetical protein ABIB19_000717 [Arthrobacter sp. UYEF10]
MDNGKTPGAPKNPALKKPVIEGRVTFVVTVTFAPAEQLLALLVTDTGSPERAGAAASAFPETSKPASP